MSEYRNPNVKDLGEFRFDKQSNEFVPVEKNGPKQPITEQAKSRDTDKELTAKIAAANSWEDLTAVINQIDGLQGSREFYPKATLLEQIRQVQLANTKGTLKLESPIFDLITKAADLREKVVDLVLIDRVRDELKNQKAA